MHQIEPYALWIGHAQDGHAFREIFDRGIRAIVQLALEEPAIPLPRELIYCRFPLLDGSGNDANVLRLAVTTIADFVRNKTPALVCCGAGMSRSPCLAAAAIAKAEGMSFATALERATHAHPADVAPALLQELHAALEMD